MSKTILTTLDYEDMCEEVQEFYDDMECLAAVIRGAGVFYADDVINLVDKVKAEAISHPTILNHLLAHYLSTFK